jgi:predicted AlkP superfamily phosphohydrolase/phosphomutase
VTANNCGCHLVPEVLQQLGFAAPPAAAEEGAPAARRGLSLGRIKDMVPKGARRWIADHLPWWLRDRIGASIRSENIDWARTRAFALPTDLEGCIRINLKGREPQGIVGAQDYDALCEDIANRFRELINPATGEAAVREVWIRNKIFPGPVQDQLPDIMVTWNNSAPISAMSSARMGLVEQESPDPRTGTHSPRGFCLARGDRFARGASATGRLEDIAPTVLDLVAAKAGEMDGSVLYDR